MSIDKLKSELTEAYSTDNLNALTAKLLHFKKRKQQKCLEKVCQIINQYYFFADERDPKLFTKLIMVYHPDKAQCYHDEISTQDSSQQLERLKHIIPVLKAVESMDDEVETLSAEDFEEEFGWNFQGDYSIFQEETTRNPESFLFDEENPDEEIFYGTGYEPFDGSFLSALKQKVYGRTDVDFPVTLLEDIEDVEMAECDIDHLDGIEYCLQTKILDVSGNFIEDIFELGKLTDLEEIYLAGNNIRIIDILAVLKKLKVVDLSDNDLDDVSALFYLDRLNFVDLRGNNVPQNQVNQLKEHGVVVVH